MRMMWKRLITSASLAAVLMYMGIVDGGSAGARPLTEADFESAPAQASVSAPAAAVSLQTAGKKTGTGYSFDKGITRVSLPAGTQSVSIANTNGTIEIKQGNVKEMEVHMTVTVHQATAEEAKAVADKAGMKVSKGADLEIRTYSESYGNWRYPSLDLTLTLPQGMKAELQAETENGNLSLSKVSSTGRIELAAVNGNISASGIGNALKLHTVNGNVQVSEAKDRVEVTVTNGNVKAEQIAGALTLKATNGNLSVKDALAAVEAVTVAGNIHVKSRKVGGDWKVTTAVGNVELAWPGNAGVVVDAESAFEEIETDFPLTVKNHRASGKLGAGTYQIRAKSMAGLSLMQN